MRDSNGKKTQINGQSQHSKQKKTVRKISKTNDFDANYIQPLNYVHSIIAFLC